MNNGVMHTNGSTLIFNGGEPLPGCPTSWPEAEKWIENANGDNDEGQPLWSFDCGFKLDYDGPILRISSRFYPPTSHGGSTWDGTVSVMIFDDDIETKKFDCESLEQLKLEVEEYVRSIKTRVAMLFQATGDK